MTKPSTSRARLVGCHKMSRLMVYSSYSKGMQSLSLKEKPLRSAGHAVCVMSLSRLGGGGHSSQMYVDRSGDAISFFTSCWDLRQNERVSDFSVLVSLNE